MATIQWNDSGTWRDIDGQWSISAAISKVQLAPKATLQIFDDVLDAGTEVRIYDSDTATTVFGGYARSAGTVQESGERRVTVKGYGYRLFVEAVTLSKSSVSDQSILSDAISNTSVGGQFTLNFKPATTTIDSYDVSERPVKDVFREICDRGGYIWWVSADKTITVDTPGGRGSTGSIDIGDGANPDPASITNHEPGAVESVTNRVVVDGKGGEEVVTATATDSTSISNYGERTEKVTSEWASTTADAQAIADALLRPDPVPSAEIIVDPNHLGSLYDNLVNYQVTITDPNRGLASEALQIERQEITEGPTTLEAGAATGIDIAALNRQRRSSADSEVFDLAGLVGVLDDIADGTNFGKVALSVLNNNSIPLLDSLDGVLDDIDDGANFGKVAADALDASGFHFLVDAVGDLGDVNDGGGFAKIDDTVTSSNELLDIGVNIQDAGGTIARQLDGLFADDATKNRTVLDGTEVLTGSISKDEITANTITANEIDTLSLTTGELDITSATTSDAITFDVASFLGFDWVSMEASGDAAIGASAPFDLIRADDLVAYQAGIGSNSNIPTGDGEMEIAPATANAKIIADTTDDANPMLRPNSDAIGTLGDGDGTTSSTAWLSLHTFNIYNYSPAPLDSDKSPGPNHVDTEELKNASWDNPPAYTAQREVPTERGPDGEVLDTEHEQLDEGAVELAALANYLLEVCGTQQQKIEQLDERLSTLEQQV